MRRILNALIIAIASLGLAAGATSALAQKTEPSKDAAKKSETAAKDATKKAAEPPKADAKKAEPMDINSASEKDLATLKGIGDVRAKAIVKGRPYKGKDELVQKKIIPQSVYDEIKELIIAKQDTAKAAEPAKKPAEPAKKPAEPKK
jgi:DNA uptake protein ComE-like DNA-binding protein